ncbi:MAG: hypothetical protein V1672_03005 [Candidatus Diapherotrites archaeon]
MAWVISNYNTFKEKLNGTNFDDNNPLSKALQHHFSKKGVISIKSKDKGFPILTYPSKPILKSKILVLTERKKSLQKHQAKWKQKRLEAKSYHLTNNVKKLTSPLYWKHVAKCATNKDYKSDSDKVQLPAHLVTDPRWEPMIKTFINDEDYRKQLTETVDKSIVYQKDKKVARFADDLRNFRIIESDKKIEEIESKLNEIREDLFSLNELLKWSNK